MPSIGLSVDPASDHERRPADIKDTEGQAPNYPVIADADFNVAELYGMLPASASGDPKARAPADPATSRARLEREVLPGNLVRRF